MGTIKVKNGYENKGTHGSHGKFSTKHGADEQRKAMFANGYKAPGYADGGEAGESNFDKMVHHVESEGYSDQAATKIAAKIGDEKYGVEGMARKAEASRMRHEHMAKGGQVEREIADLSAQRDRDHDELSELDHEPIPNEHGVCVQCGAIHRAMGGDVGPQGQSDEAAMRRWQRMNELRSDDDEDEDDMHSDYEPSVDMDEDRATNDRVLDEVLRLCGDPDNDHEYAEETGALETSIDPGMKAKDDEPPVEQSEDIDPVTKMHQEMMDEESKRKYKGYGLQRRYFPN